MTGAAACACPDPVDVPDQPYVASLEVDNITVDSSPESWTPLCATYCAETQMPCSVLVNTCDCNGIDARLRCGGREIFDHPIIDRDAWVGACQKACGPEQNCEI